MTLKSHELAALIDHTVLKAETTARQIEQLCQEAIEHGFAAVCVNPIFVSRATGILRGKTSKIATVVGFPLGANSLRTKLYETEQAITDGATEIDMVIAIGEMLSGNEAYVRDEIQQIVKCAGQIPVKVILENAYLSQAQKIRVCEFSRDVRAAFVKTSTGFAVSSSIPIGATVEDVALMRKTVGAGLGVKASGGVRNLATALQMIEAGANRIGTSSGVAILKELKQPV